jgi:hypothetical protein
MGSQVELRDGRHSSALNTVPSAHYLFSSNATCHSYGSIWLWLWLWQIASGKVSPQIEKNKRQAFPNARLSPVPPPPPFLWACAVCLFEFWYALGVWCRHLRVIGSTSLALATVQMNGSLLRSESRSRCHANLTAGSDAALHPALTP